MTSLAYFGGKPVREKTMAPAYPLFSRKELKYLSEVLRSHQIAEGQFTRRLEENFAHFIGTKYCVATSSGTAALHLSLLSLGVGKGDEVITSPYTFIATSNACLYVGAKPVFVDIDPKSFNIDPEKIEEKITAKTKAMIPVHIWGHPCEMERILRIAKDNGLFVVEDASHAHGAEYDGKKVGAFGNVNCFSLYATKIITSAEGGLVTTDDESIASRIRILKRLGEVGKYEHKEIGYNYRMSDVHAAIGLAQLERIDAFFKKRKQNSTYLTKLLTEFNEYIELPTVKGNVKHAFYYYAILLRRNLLEKVSRDMFDKILRAENIVPTSYYPKPLHLQEAYKFLGYKKSDFPVAEDVCNRTITLPIHPALNKKDMFDIYTAIGKIAQHFKG
jgi:dTDP-4-amino-4,6-dideoxygalactose transaminase